ncbi:branched-chain amino acid ABC transporter permease [Benzoatithermus flavus]|uniref:Branched-chain amino acid ABC transporter permease n=1 Tax=Benzoatithermus flavus TaxID=3108223 RepID=A0ABU8XRM3_9PROT
MNATALPAAVMPAGHRLGAWAPAVVVFLALALLPVVFEGYVVYILPQYMLFGVMAMSLALLWGQTGILSFGQAGFFAIGGYAIGIGMSHELPINPAYIGILTGILVCAVTAALIGYFLFSAGVRDSYFVLVTLALSIMVEQIAVSQSELTGGWNGMFIMRPILTAPGLELPLDGDVSIYYVVLVVAAAVYAGLRALTTARFGKILVGIRENETRMEALGYRTVLYKTAAFALSAGIAGLAGALYGTHAGFVSPSLGGALFSTEAVVWVAVAGRSSLLAAFLGGVIVSSLSNYLSALTPGLWQLFMGLLFIAAITLFRGGIAGFLGRLPARRRAMP